MKNFSNLTQIYESNNSIVYRARRESDGEPVIIKLLKQEYPSPEEVICYKQEYEIAHSLNINGVVKAYNLEKYLNRWLIIFEDFGGESLNQLRKNQKVSPNLEDFLKLAIKIAETLAEIHGHNLIHKDINPSNIVFNPETGELKIIDFGIATILSRETPTLKHPNILEGTLPYISPEQTGRTNRYLDYRTDFYSLGVTFYELLTKQLPFETKDTMEMLHCHLARKPLSPREIKGEIPAIVSDLIMKLLEKNAEDRYQSAWGVKEDLELCLHQLQTTNQILTFPLAIQDIYDKFQIPQKLYGREREIETLLAAFNRVNENSSELMLVAGYSGIGKSVLVREIYQAVTESKGYFIAGKFDQFQRNIPYSAVIKAFEELVEQLLTEPEENLQEWREKIVEALGANGQIIIDVIPEVELIIGEQKPVPELSPTEAQNRFKVVLEKFIGVFTKPEHPLAIFLDDLQWADRASLNLLELLMTAPERQNLLVIGAYRDNEVSESHPWILTLKEIATSGAVLNTISLSPLALSDISTLIADTLKTTQEMVESLAELVLEKTGGNPFFIKEFVKSLYTDKLLQFDRESNCWRWSLEEIKGRNITDNVVELMAGKIQKLPEETQEVLKIAACIGNDFELETLAIVCEKTAKELAVLLRSPVAEGLLLLLGDSYKLIELEVMPDSRTGILPVNYKFAHDRIQQAAYLLIDENQKQATHLQIGRLLLANLSQAKSEEIIFDLVDRFNQGRTLITDEKELDKVIQLNFIAGQKAKAATAYISAVKYFNFAVENLRQDSWETNYDFTIALYLETLEAEYLNLNYQVVEKLANIILEKANTVFYKFRVYAIKILFYSAKNQMENAINSGLEILEMLGVSLIETPPETNLQIEELYDLPVMTDATKEAAMGILMMLFGPIYTTNPQKLASLSFTMVHLSLEYGNCSLAAYAYGLYGLLLCGVLGDIEAGYQYGKLALRVLDKFAAKEIKCRVSNKFYSFIIHWKEAAHKSLKPLRKETIPAGLETGEIEFTCYASVNYAANIALLGNHLEKARQHHREYLELIGNLKQEFQLFYTQIWAQYVDNLLGLSASPTILDGEAFKETETLPILLENNNLSSLYCFYLVKTILCYLFKDYQNAAANAKLAEKYEAGIVGLFVATQNPFYYSLALLANYKNVDKAQQKEYLEKVAANQKRLEYWASYAPMNYQHKYDLVVAERAKVLGENWQAAELYEAAITGAAQNSYLHEEAIAYELAGEFYLGRGMEKIGETYIIEARNCYFAWGTVVKVKDLETRYPSFFARHVTEGFVTTSTTSSSTGSNVSAALDLNSFVKASQAISGEIVLDILLTKMMQIIIENAGAEKVYLLLDKEGDWVIEATGTVDEVAVLSSIPLNTKLLPLTMINYVARTKKSVVLGNAAREGDFIRDEYIASNTPKSVLCTPLIQQGKLVGILYLENNLASGAFTTDRVEVLQLLSSQAAIALNNALLYTQVRDNQEFLHAVITTMQDGFSVVDASGIKVRVNATFCQMIGFSQEELIGIKAPFAYWPPEELDIIEASFAKILAGDLHPVELTFMRKNGERFPVLVSPSVLTNDKGEPAYYFALVKDITELKKAQEVLAEYNRTLEFEVTKRTLELSQALENLKVTQQQLVESEKMASLGSLVAGVAHEINTPIGTSISVASFLEHETSSFVSAIQGGQLRRSVLNSYIETATESSQSILRNLQRAGELIQSFKQVAVDQTSLEKRIFAVKPYIEEVLVSLHPRFKKTTHILTVKGDDAIKIDSYPGALSQIVTNLAINSLTHAYQASESGQLCIEVILKGQTLLIGYSDDGCGIEPENQTKIFDPFFTTARSKGGSGLGLHIIYNLVTQTLKGTIKCESTVGGGTKFMIDFPVEIVNC